MLVHGATLSTLSPSALLALGPTGPGTAAAARSPLLETRAAAAATRLGGSALDGAQQELARSGLEKIGRGLAAFGSCDLLESALAQLLCAQIEAGQQQADSAIATVKQKHGEIKQQRMREEELLRKKLEAERSRSFWTKLVDVFKAIGAAVSAACSIFTGGAGAVGAGLLIASIVVAHTAPPSWGQWVSLGLGAAGAICGGFAAPAGALAQKAALVGKALTTTCQLGVGAGSVAAGVEGSAALRAEAGLSELQALRQRALADAEEERELLREIVDAEARAVEVMTRALASKGRIELHAVQQRR